MHLNNEDFTLGKSIVYNAIQKPFLQILQNAGQNESKIFEKIRKSDSMSDGFDAHNECFVNMIEAGIIDPTKVVRTATEDAVSVAGLFLLTEVVALEEMEILVNDLDNSSQSFRIKTS